MFSMKRFDPSAAVSKRARDPTATVKEEKQAKTLQKKLRRSKVTENDDGESDDRDDNGIGGEQSDDSSSVPSSSSDEEGESSDVEPSGDEKSGMGNKAPIPSDFFVSSPPSSPPQQGKGSRTNSKSSEKVTAEELDDFDGNFLLDGDDEDAIANRNKNPNAAYLPVTLHLMR